MISVSINIAKIDRSKLYESTKTGTKYLNLLLLNQEDTFGNRILIQPVSKEAYAQGVRGEQVGTWKEFQPKSQSKTSASAAASKPRPHSDGVFESPEQAYDTAKRSADIGDTEIPF